MTETITRERAVELLTKVVVSKGEDFVYDQDAVCVYFNRDGSPSCVVGHVFADLGVRKSDLHDVGGYGHANGTAIAGLTIDGLDIQPGAVRVLQVAQRHQDAGHPWGEALEAARAAGVEPEAGAL